MNMFDLTGKIALVTGGAHSIGFAIGCGLAQAGAKIVFNCTSERSRERGVANYAAEGITAYGYVANVTSEEEMNALLEELGDETLAVTSVGRDGERTDVVTGTEKPEIWVRAGTLFATATGMLPLCDVTLETVGLTDVSTPLGRVAVFRALSDGYVQIAGPSAVGQLYPLTEEFFRLGARRVFIDGAAGRKSLAAAGEGGCAILCVGASMEGGAERIAAETAHVCTLFSAPKLPFPPRRDVRFALCTPEGETLPLELDHASGAPLWNRLPRTPCVLWCAGGVTNDIVRALTGRGAPITLASADATRFLFDRSVGERFFRQGGALAVEKELTIAAVCANPWSAYGKHLERETLLAALRQAVSVHVVDVKENAT